ncbi:MAG: ATP-dependent protease, Lon family, partial [Desulfofundulus sp.]
MKVFLHKFKGSSREEPGTRFKGVEQLRRQVNALYSLVAGIYGSDKLVLRAGKLNVLHLMRSDCLEDRVLALQKLVFEDPTLDRVPDLEEIPAILEQVEEEIADILARRTVEDELEKKISEKLQQRHEEYVKEIKMQVLKENTGPENAQ